MMLTPSRVTSSFGDADGIARIGAVVARDHLDLAAEHAALRIDLLDRQFPALLVWIEEGGLRLVAVEFADLDRALRECRAAETCGGCGHRGKPKQVRSGDHAGAPF